MLIFRNVLRQNLIKIYTKIHQIAPLFSKFLKGAYMPPNHISMRVATVVAKRIRTFCYFVKKGTNESETAKQITKNS